MGNRYLALIRGINVGRAKRVAMADLRALVEGLGYTDVRTLLNSGNIVFTVLGKTRASIGPKIENAMATDLGVSARVFVLSAPELAAVIAENPLLKVATDHSRLLVTVFDSVFDGRKLESLTKSDSSEDVLAIGSRAAYVWCAGGILASKLVVAINRVVGDSGTSRNWATLLKLNALVQDPK